MNPGICYVYEYENKQRKRNVGFLKITRHYQSCILQIHVRGIPVGNGAALDLYAFYLHGHDMIGVPIASLTCFGRSVSVRLPISESHFPERRPLSGIDGFLIRLPGSRDSVFWAASENSFDADLSHLRPPEEENDEPAAGEQPEAPDEGNADTADSSDTAVPTEPEEAPAPENSLPPAESVFPESTLPPAESVSPESTLPPEESISSESTLPPTEALPPESILPPGESSTPEDTAAPADDGGSPDVPPSAPLSEESRQDRAHTLQASEQGSAPPGQDRSPLTARKIERSEISKLPRRFWFLANNSFLLHGYHNYNHLLLVEEDGHVWLGVPGIYDVREARAADLFGFPQFTRSYAPMLGLSEDERNDGADFGHWCRYLDSDGPAR